MLEYNRIDVSEEIDVHKTNGLCECIICYYWYFSSFLEDVDLCDVLMSNKISFDEKKLEILYWLLVWWL